MCITDMGTTTRRQLGLKLNQDQLLGKDWKMMAEKLNFSHDEVLRSSSIMNYISLCIAWILTIYLFVVYLLVWRWVLENTSMYL